MNIKRLQMMVELLERISSHPPVDKKFNMTEWDCGTASCACGFAMFDREFNKEGFTFARLETVNGNVSIVPAFECPTHLAIGWEAVEEFFNLDYEDASHLFSSHSYYDKGAITPDDVAERITEFYQGV